MASFRWCRFFGKIQIGDVHLQFIQSITIGDAQIDQLSEFSDAAGGLIVN